MLEDRLQSLNLVLRSRPSTVISTVRCIPVETTNEHLAVQVKQLMNCHEVREREIDS